MKRIVVLGAQVPFVRGGAEFLNEELVRQINLWGETKGVVADLVQVPYKWYPETEILSAMLAWRLLDLSESNGQKVDLCVCTKFPTYAASHSNKALWLVHQHRVLYDLEGSAFDFPHRDANEIAVRDAIRASDRELLAGIEVRHTISQTVTDRLSRYCQLESTVLYPPSRLAPMIREGGYGDYVLYVGRLETIKRPDLLVRALTHAKQGKVVIAGSGAGPYAAFLRQLVSDLGLEDRVTLTGFISDEALVDLIAGCRAVFYSPVDEDYGFATLEAFAARKPVITVEDSGEVARIVAATGSGWISTPTPEAVADSLAACFATGEHKLKAMAASGHALSETITWNKVIEQLVESRL